MQPDSRDDAVEQLHSEIDSLTARVRVQELALLEVLHLLSPRHGDRLAGGLRARVNEWSLHAGPRFTPTVDESASEQLATLLIAMNEAPLQLDLLHD
jgi:hypothetical protein